MAATSILESQRNAAKWVGFAYLFALIPAVFAEFYVRGTLVVHGNAAQTALNIMHHERLFRLGIASNLTVFAMDVVLIMALYIVLQQVNRNLALVAAGWGLVETTILVIVTLNDFDVLRYLDGASYLQVFENSQLQSLARLSIGAHNSTYNVGLVFAGLRSTAFCYLWFRSGYIPKILAGWGIFASLLMGAFAFSFIIFPALAQVFSAIIYGGPIFIFELSMGFWLLLKELRSSNINY